MSEPIRLSASQTLTLGEGEDRLLRVDRGGVELFSRLAFRRDEGKAAPFRQPARGEFDLRYRLRIS